MSGPATLNCLVRWNQFYKTARNSVPPQHMISAIQQTQTASNNFVWLYSPLATDENMSRDSQICIRDLHPSLDGVRPVESLHTEQSCIAIKKNKQLTQQELSQIDFRLQLPPLATIEVASQVDHSIALHQLTVDRLDSTAHNAQKLSVAELQQILMQASESQQAALQHQLHPQAPPSFPYMHVGTSQSSHMQHNILSSRVIDDMHDPAHATASASNTDKTVSPKLHCHTRHGYHRFLTSTQYHCKARQRLTMLSVFVQSQGPFNFSSLKHLVDQNFHWVKTKLDGVYDHVSHSNSHLAPFWLHK